MIFLFTEHATQLDDLHSVSITLSCRITLDFLIAGKTV
jgi:hypothetical protein